MSTILQQRLGYTFAKPELLVRALTHPSKGEGHYQRLEFLGDAVLGMVVSDWLFEAYPEAAEGELSRRLVAMVREEALVVVAESWGVWEFVVYGDGEVKKASILADVVEGILGAIWLDGGWDAVKGVVRGAWADMLGAKDEKDPKSQLQEWLQGQGLPLPQYDVLEESGPPHERVFRVIVTTAKGSCQAEGRTKQAAGAEAALQFLKNIGEI